MPTITATALPAYGWVRLDVDFTDQPGVAWARVERVVVATGVVTPVRPYLAYNGWYQRLSGGRAMLYDTEAPLDVAVYYRTATIDEPDITYASPTAVGVVVDTFTRSVAAGTTLGTSDSGHTWASAGVTTQASVNGTTGVLSASARATYYGEFIFGADRSEVEFVADVRVPVAPTGDGVLSMFHVRRKDASNEYTYLVNWNVGGALTIQINKTLAGVASVVKANTPGITWAAGTYYRVRGQAMGNRLRFKVWPAAGTQPAAWNIDVVDYSHVSAGPFRWSVYVSGTNSNTLPFAFHLDNLRVSSYDPGAAQQTILASGGGFWLRSPLHPAKDRRLTLRSAAGCPTPAGKILVGLEAEQCGANAAGLAPANRRLATWVSRPRRGVETSVTVVTRRFVDRDELLDTLDDGSPLQLAAPPEFGIALRYLGVGDADVRRALPDHRFEPRVFVLPAVETDQPAGPATGVLGARFRDLCATYATWDAAVTAGKTYDDLIRVS